MQLEPFQGQQMLELRRALWRKHSDKQPGSQQPHKCCLTIYFWKHICPWPLQCITPSTKMWGFLIQKGAVIFSAVFLPLVSEFCQSLQEMLSKITKLHQRHYLESRASEKGNQPSLSKCFIWKPERLKDLAGYSFPSILNTFWRQPQSLPAKMRGSV